ncbi:hypothetical protein G9A89_007901 [Geosiphon pyriformis]|nr:hypothetical protein G9A89_007901 [Geosiphon pyriformis]
MSTVTFTSLPNEILLEIFKKCLVDPDGYLELWRLQTVSKKWRNLIRLVVAETLLEKQTWQIKILDRIAPNQKNGGPFSLQTIYSLTDAQGYFTFIPKPPNTVVKYETSNLNWSVALRFSRSPTDIAYFYLSDLQHCPWRIPLEMKCANRHKGAMLNYIYEKGITQDKFEFHSIKVRPDVLFRFPRHG